MGEVPTEGKGLVSQCSCHCWPLSTILFFSVFLSGYFGVLEHIKDENKAFESRDMYDDEDHICGVDFNQIHLQTGAD